MNRRDPLSLFLSVCLAVLRSTSSFSTRPNVTARLQRQFARHVRSTPREILNGAIKRAGCATQSSLFQSRRRVARNLATRGFFFRSRSVVCLKTRAIVLELSSFSEARAGWIRLLQLSPRVPDRSRGSRPVSSVVVGAPNATVYERTPRPLSYRDFLVLEDDEERAPPDAVSFVLLSLFPFPTRFVAGGSLSSCCSRRLLNKCAD